MDLRISPANRYDAIDREEFKRMVESESFQILKARLVAERDRLVRLCLTDDDLHLVRWAQGAVASLETALNLPGIILQEMPNKPH